jgi:hypothetical protein
MLVTLGGLDRMMMGEIAQHSEIKPRNSEQASVANHRQQQDQWSPVAGKRDAQNSHSNQQ